MKANQAEISHMVARADQLGNSLRERPMDLVLCHSDLHAGNLLIDAQWNLILIDHSRAFQPAARFSRGAPHRQGAVDEPAGLRGLWPAHVRQLSEQVDRLLWVYAEEE